MNTVEVKEYIGGLLGIQKQTIREKRYQDAQLDGAAAYGAAKMAHALGYISHNELQRYARCALDNFITDMLGITEEEK